MNDLCCILCNLKLKSIFISCIECNSAKDYICLECFSQGLENSTHKNTHSYKVLNLNRIKTFSSWNLGEELDLIDNFNDLNTSSWTKISTYIQENCDYNKKTPLECKTHFDEWSNIFKNLENFQINSSLELFVGDDSFIMRENDVNPPRPSVHTYQYRRMSGYRAARGDFEAEFNDAFEMKYISDIDYHEVDGNMELEDDTGEEMLNKHENDELEDSLKLTILDSYRDLIKERYKMKKFIRDFGLLNDLAISSMHNQVIPTGITHKIVNYSQQQQQNIVPFKYYRLFESSEKLIQYIELMKYQNDVKKRLQELKEYQNNGIKRFKHVELYKKMKSIRENRNKSSFLSSLLTTVIRHDVKDNKLNAYNCQEWIKKFIIDEKEVESISRPALTANNCVTSNVTTETSVSTTPTTTTATVVMSSTASLISQQKYKNNPLKIENYPEADKLNDEEKEFCRVSRIQPIVYLRVKQILILECNKVGYVTYSRARKIASIDVNKTRKIHNFLLHLNLIKANNDDVIDS
jgi:hypothetical protein